MPCIAPNDDAFVMVIDPCVCSVVIYSPALLFFLIQGVFTYGKYGNRTQISFKENS